MSSSIASTSLGYLFYYIMGPGVSNVKAYFVSDNGNTYPAYAISDDPKTIYYFDQSGSVYAPSALKIDVNGVNVLTISLSGVVKTMGSAIVVQLSISYPQDMPFWLIQSIAGVLSGVPVSLNMVPCLVYYTDCPTGTSQPQTVCGSLGNPSANGFTGTISVRTSYLCKINVVQVVLKSNKYSLNGIPLQIILYFQSYTSEDCRNLNGCTFTVNISFRA